MPRHAALRSDYSIFMSPSLTLQQKPFKLSDIGEGINEVEIIQWRVLLPRLWLIRQVRQAVR